MIPLERLGEYTDAIERINIELSIANKLELLDALDEYLQGELPLARARRNPAGRPSSSATAREAARELVARVRARWRYLLEHLDLPVAEARADAAPGLAAVTHAGLTVFVLQDRSVRVSLEGRGARRTAANLRRRVFAPHPRRAATPSTSASCRAACSSRCTCMPATAMCTPIFRSTPTTTHMLHAANRSGGAHHAHCAQSLDGVISGEHGIGITKLEYLTRGGTRGVPQLQAARRSAGQFNPAS